MTKKSAQRRPERKKPALQREKLRDLDVTRATKVKGGVYSDECEVKDPAVVGRIR